MSEVALRDVNNIPESERMNGSPNNGKGLVDNFKEKHKKMVGGQVDLPIERDGIKTSGVDVANLEVEYIETENLTDVEDVEDCLKTLLSELGSKNWVAVCDALNNVRRLSSFHKDAIVGMLNDVISLIVKSMKNPRSALCKTAVMTSADIFKVYNDAIIDSLDPLLVELMLKSSQDKRFVCEAAESALIALTSSVSPLLLLPKLQPYIQNKNPRIRAKASMCICRSVTRLGGEGAESYGIDKLMEIGATQLSDRLPESRDAARSLLLELHSLYKKLPASEAVCWEKLCESILDPLSAQAVVRVTNNNSSRDGVVLSC